MIPQYTEKEILEVTNKLKQNFINILFNLGSLHAMNDIFNEVNEMTDETLEKLKEEEKIINDYLSAINELKKDGVLNVR